jgi:colicin import membrane protein
MARKLRTYTTSAGFFDLAVAAPSMKAALEAWGSKNNLFQHGFARETGDRAIVAATMARPGVVLRRPVGSSDAFSEQARLPRDLARTVAREKPAAARRSAKPGKPPSSDKRRDDKAVRAAARAFEKERERRDAERRREDKAQEKERQRRERAVAAAEAALVAARREHEERVAAEDTRWHRKKAQLEEALRRAKG